MAIVIQVLGGLLFVAGLAGLVYGVDLLPTERGVAATIASVCAIAGGVIAFALGLVVKRLDRIASVLKENLDAAGVESDARDAARDEEVVAAQPPLDGASLTAAPAPEPVDRLSADLLKDLPQPELPKPPPVPMRTVQAEQRPTVPFDPPEPVIEKPVPPPLPERPRFRLPGFGRAAAAGAAAATATVAAKAAMETMASTAGEAPEAPKEAAQHVSTPEVTASGEPAPQAPEGFTAAETLAVQPASIEPETAEAPNAAPEILDAEKPLPEGVPPDAPAEDAAALADNPAPATVDAGEEAAPDAGASAETSPTDTAVSEPAPAPRFAPTLPPDPMAELEAELDRLIPLTPRRAHMPAPPPEPAIEVAPPAPPEPAPIVEVTPPLPPEEPVPPDVLVDPDERSSATPVRPPDAEIVGSYESGGARYTMYANGGVIVEAEGRSLQFASLEALREFIESGAKA